MNDLDTRFLAYVVWGIGTVLVYGLVFRQRMMLWKMYRDNRSRRDFISGLALFLTAMASFLAITFVFFGEAGTGIRGLFVALALGAFFGNGLVQFEMERRMVKRYKK